MYKAFIKPPDCLRCIKYHAADACPVKAIFCIDAEEPTVVEPKIYHGCGDFIAKCPAAAVALKEN
jgi:MinD superfamily P-loop ATPase